MQHVCRAAVPVFALFLVLVSFSSAAFAGGLSGSPAIEPAIHYKIEARLIDKENILLGREFVTYKNTSMDEIRELYFYLYANRYRDRYSTTAREASFYHDYRIGDASPAQRGYIDINSAQIAGMPVKFQVIDTLLKVEPARPLAPGDEVKVGIEFFLKIPRYIDRFGYAGDRYEITDWYPKVAVYGPKGWCAYQSHYLGDPYGEPASYAVTLTVPGDFLVATTGTSLAGDSGFAEGLREALENPPAEHADSPPPQVPLERPASPVKTLAFVAVNANDFVWAAGPSYCVEEDEIGGMRLFCLYKSENRRAWKRDAIARLKSAMEWFGENVGPCPFPKVTLVDSEAEKALAYPMMLFSKDPSEESIARAVAKMYFSSVVASDPVNSPWLDEGVAAFLAREYLVKKFGPTGVDPHGLNSYEKLLPQSSARDSVEGPIFELAREHLDEPIATAAHRFFDLPNYQRMAVDKASLFFGQLKNRVGPGAFGRALKKYYAIWTFRHPAEGDLRKVLEEESGMSLSEFFGSWLRGRNRCDYALGRVKVTKMSTSGRYVSDLSLKRLGGIRMPVEVAVKTASGGQMIQVCSGDERVRELRFETDSKPVRFEIDPARKLAEKNLINNRKPKKFRFAVDYPFMNYKPRDTYLLTYRPSFWNNHNDKVKMGMLLTGSSNGNENAVKIGGWAGLASRNFDWLLQYSTPFRALGGRTLLFTRAQKNEGRQGGDVTLSFNLSPRIERKPRIGVVAGFHTLELKGADYVDSNLYDSGIVNKVSVSYWSYLEGYHWQSMLRADFSKSGSFINSDYHFNRLQASGVLNTFAGGVTLMMRGFTGITFDRDVVPKQERFYLNGAGPLEEFEHWYTRSKGSLGRTLNYHLTGGGNMRAYNEYPVSAKRLIAVNFEASKKLYEGTPGRGFIANLFNEPEGAIFIDTAFAWRTDPRKFDNEALYEFGFGLRWKPLFLKKNYFVRFDFPIYINRPSFNSDGDPQKEYRFRWVFSFERIDSR